MSTHNLCFEQKYEKYQSFLSENFQFLEVKFYIYLNRRVFLMAKGCSSKTIWMIFDGKHYVFWLCWGLTTRQPLRVILCRLPEKGKGEKR